MRYAQINTPLSQKLAQKKCLIAAHRGSWGGNIAQNTVGAYKAALQMGADIVETDVNATTDGVLYSFHDGNEQRVFGVEKSIRQMDSKEVESYHPINTCNELTAARINRLTEVLDFLSHGELLNIDRAWNIIPQLLEVLDRYPNAKYQVVIKAPLKAKAAYEYLNAHPVKYMFMPICYSFEDVEAALSYPDLNSRWSCSPMRASKESMTGTCSCGSMPSRWATSASGRFTPSWTTTCPSLRTPRWAGASCSKRKST